MRYLVAVIVAGLVIAGGTVFVWQTHRSLEQRLRHAIKEGQAAGRVSPEIDADHVVRGDLEVTLPAALQFRLALATLFTRWRFVLAMVVLLASLGIGHFFPWSYLANLGRGGAV